MIYRIGFEKKEKGVVLTFIDTTNYGFIEFSEHPLFESKQELDNFVLDYLEAKKEGII